MNVLTPSDIRLRIVPVESLQLHEEDDPYRVKRLMSAFNRDGKLKNPIIVAEQPGPGNTYVVLDGATRTSALREMGIRCALVQIVDYSSDRVELKVWNHIVVGFPSHRLLGNLGELKELTVLRTETDLAQEKLAQREVIACLSFRNGQNYAVSCEGDIHCQADQLCNLVSIYRGKAEVHRTAFVELQTLIEEYPDLTAIVSFPPFTPSEIMQIAFNGHKVPMGITRHLILGRALGLAAPLEILNDENSLDDKNNWLETQIRQRLRTNKIRLYQEPVFIFDD
ncbi:MAG TPA: ParB N-terminal domain-containing protein [Anaerolineales bacterium]|nr:ParB N-terminal domain-containing protein [Anaerolineales bacterium]